MQWTDKRNGIDTIDAADINTVAHQVIDNETAISELNAALPGKVDKVAGYGLSKNDFTDTLKSKLNGIAEGAEVNVQADWNQGDSFADDYIKNKPNLSLKEDAGNKVTSLSSESTDGEYPSAKCVYDELTGLDSDIEAISPWSEEDDTEQATGDDAYNLNAVNNGVRIYTSDDFSVLEINIPSGEYPYTFKSRLTFNSPSIPTTVVYVANSELINWAGTDCYNYNGNSVFRPKANKHYDVDFYFNGTQFVGKVNGYVLAEGQEQLTSFSSTSTNTLTLSNCLDDFSIKELEIEGSSGGVGEVNYFNVGTSNNWLKLGTANSVSISGNVVTGTSLTKTAYQYIARRFIAAGSSLLGKTVTISFDCKLTNWTRSTTMLVGYFSNGTSGQWQTLTGGNKTNITNGTYVYTVNIPSEIPSGANGFYLFWYTGFSASDITIGQTIELSDIMVLERSYTASTIHGYIPYGKYGLPFTVNGASGTIKAMITLDEPLGYNVTADVLTLNYDKRSATKFIDAEQTQTIDVTSQIDWQRVPNTQEGSTDITINTQITPSEMSATFYINNGGN